MALFKRSKSKPASASDQGTDPASGSAVNPTLSRDASGRLKPSPAAKSSAGNAAHPVASGVAAKAPPDTSALNRKIVQAVQLSNSETTSYNSELASAPPELMVGQVTGLAVQDAQNYMNAIMQIAVAAQAVAIKKAAEGPVQEAEQIPFLSQIQGIVDHAVKVYGTVSDTAGTSSKTVFSDLKSG